MQADMGYIERHKDDGDFEPDDEALIFLDDNNERTIHVRHPQAKRIAQAIIEALRPLYTRDL